MAQITLSASQCRTLGLELAGDGINRAHSESLIEGMIDSGGLAGLLDRIVEVCNDKAEHLQSNWQDETAGGAWTRIASKIDSLRKDCP